MIHEVQERRFLASETEIRRVERGWCLSVLRQVRGVMRLVVGNMLLPGRVEWVARNVSLVLKHLV